MSVERCMAEGDVEVEDRPIDATTTTPEGGVDPGMNPTPIDATSRMGMGPMVPNREVYDRIVEAANRYMRPEMKAVFDALPEEQRRQAYLANYRDIISAGARASGGREVAYDPGSEFLVPVKTQIGEINWPWPINAEEGFERMRDVLARLELAKAENAGAVAAELQTIESIINAFLDMRNKTQHPDIFTEERIEIAKKMNAELNARLTIHKAFMQFRVTMPLKDVKQVLDSIGPGNLNAIFSIDQFVDGMDLYEKHVAQYLELEGTNKDLARNEVRAELVGLYGSDMEKELVENIWNPLTLKEKLIMSRIANLPPAVTPGDRLKRVEYLRKTFQDVYGLDDKGRPKVVPGEGGSGLIKDDAVILSDGSDPANISDEFINRFMGSADQLIPALNKQAWAQTMSERVYRMFGRATEQLLLKEELTPEVMAGGDLKKPAKGASDPAFEGEAPPGGEFGQRKLFRFPRFLWAQAGKAFPVDKLLKDVDLEGGSYFARVLGGKVGGEYLRNGNKFITYVQRRIKSDAEYQKMDDDEKRKYISESEYQKLEAKEKEKYIAEADFNNLALAAQQEIMRNEVSHANFGDTRVKLNFKAVDWKRFDFRSIAEDQPMGYWTHRHLVKPEDARSAMFDKAGDFLRTPNKENLYALNDALDYLEGKQWAVKEQLALNFIDFARKERNPQTGKLRYTHDQIVAMANELIGSRDDKKASFVQFDHRKEFLEKALAYENFFEHYWNKFAARFGVNFLLGLILELIKGIFKSGTSGK